MPAMIAAATSTSAKALMRIEFWRGVAPETSASEDRRALPANRPVCPRFARSLERNSGATETGEGIQIDTLLALQ
jgi:hypothetical protein